MRSGTLAADEKRSRTVFAQETIKVDDVARELEASRAIGSSEVVERFVATRSVRTERRSPAATRSRSTSPRPRARCATSSASARRRPSSPFRAPVPDGVAYLSRTHPVVEGLAAMSSTPRSIRSSTASPSARARCARRLVETRTTVLLVRIRFDVITNRRGEEDHAQIAEEVARARLRGRAQRPGWLGEEKPRRSSTRRAATSRRAGASSSPA